MPTPPHADASDVMLEEDALVGTSLGNYRLLQRIGVGATALVYRAEHTQLGRTYAVKILHPSIAIRPGMRERFLREAKTAGQLNHENIIFIADFAIDPQLGPYMVMEYLEGENLQSVLEREESIPVPRLTQIALQVCKALSVAHNAGIIHRDLKPENIFLVPRSGGPEVVKILDFGIARLVQSTASLTGEGKLLGTPLYMSPEQCRGNSELTPASDLYSFGVVLFEMLTGRTPFVGDNPQKLLIDHFLVDPPELPAHYPESLRALQADLLAKSPGDRPAHIDIVSERLQAALQEARSFVAAPSSPFEASFTHEQLPALGSDDGEILSELDMIQGDETSHTTKAAAFTESTQETSYPSPPSRPRRSGREELSTQEQLPAANTPLPLTTPPPSSQIAALSSADAVRQSPRWGEELATAAWDAVPDHEKAALGGSIANTGPRIGPGQGMLDISLTDPSRMTLQGSELSTNDILEVANQNQHVVVKQNTANTPSQGPDPLLNDLENLFNHPAQEEAPGPLHRSDDQPPIEADEELLRDLDQLNPAPANQAWTQGYGAAAPAWQDEPVIELRQKKAPPPVRVERGTGPSIPAAPTPPPSVRVEKGNKKQTPIATSRENRKPDAALVRTEIDLSLRDVYKISGQMGEDLDLDDLLQLPTERGESPKPPPAPSFASTIQEGSPLPTPSQLSNPSVSSLPTSPIPANVSSLPTSSIPANVSALPTSALTAPSNASQVQTGPASRPLGTSPNHLSFNDEFANDAEPSRGSPTWIVLLFVLLAALAGVLVYWLWLRT